MHLGLSRHLQMLFVRYMTAVKCAVTSTSLPWMSWQQVCQFRGPYSVLIGVCHFFEKSCMHLQLRNLLMHKYSKVRRVLKVEYLPPFFAPIDIHCPGDTSC